MASMIFQQKSTTPSSGGGGTSGEMFTLVLEKLISIKEHQREVYAVIREETDWMIAYSKVIGYW
jgi:hypothetical protein